MNDPKHVAFARELRDRYLEQVATNPHVLPAKGRYDVSRLLPAGDASPAPESLPLRQLPAA